MGYHKPASIAQYDRNTSDSHEDTTDKPQYSTPRYTEHHLPTEKPDIPCAGRSITHQTQDDTFGQATFPDINCYDDEEDMSHAIVNRDYTLPMRSVPSGLEYVDIHDIMPLDLSCRK